MGRQHLVSLPQPGALVPRQARRCPTGRIGSRQLYAQHTQTCFCASFGQQSSLSGGESGPRGAVRRFERVAKDSMLKPRNGLRVEEPWLWLSNVWRKACDGSSLCPFSVRAGLACEFWKIRDLSWVAATRLLRAELSKAQSQWLAGAIELRACLRERDASLRARIHLPGCWATCPLVDLSQLVRVLLFLACSVSLVC